MTAQIELAIPYLVVFIMLVVGMDLRFSDFLRIRRYPVLVFGIVFGQWIVLVLAAGFVGWLLDLPPGITGGAILFAAAPVAALSGYYAKLAGGDLALAVTVAATSNLLAAVVTPMVASFGFWWFLGSEQAMTLPVFKVAMQTVLGLLIPLLAGMAIRHYAANWITRWRGPLQGLGVFAIAVMLAWVMVDQFAVFRPQIGLLLGASLLFTLAMLASGLLAVKPLARTYEERQALLWGFPARNVAIATLAATSVTGQMAIATFIAILFVTQVSLLLPLALWLGYRSRQRHRDISVPSA